MFGKVVIIIIMMTLNLVFDRNLSKLFKFLYTFNTRFSRFNWIRGIHQNMTNIFGKKKLPEVRGGQSIAKIS